MPKSRSVKATPWRKPVRKKLERHVQKDCVDWARDHGWWARKFKAPGMRSVPDYLFAKKFPGTSRKVAVEFKKLGETSTDKQLKEQQAMRDAGWEVHEIDSKEKFVALFTSIEYDEQPKQQPEDWLS